MLKNWWFQTVVLEKTLESPLNSKEIQLVHPKWNQSWIFIGRADAEAETPILLATSCEKLTHQKRPWCWERLKVGVEGDDRGWDIWMASLMSQWTWIWASSRSWWWTGKPGMLQSMGSQELDMSEPLNWTERKSIMNIHWKGWCWSWNSNPLATWCKETDSFEKTLMLGKIEGGRRRGWQRMRWLDGITDVMDMNLSTFRSWWWIGKPGMLKSMGPQESDTTEQMNRLICEVEKREC